MKNKINPSVLKVELLNHELHNSTILFLEKIFYEEQTIPKELIPLKNENQKWWCIKNKDEIVGTVAAWELASEWHWGRLAIDKKLRGLGMGKKIAQKSLADLFGQGIEKITIDARDITVKMILELGGKITGKKTTFYGQAITPMEIHKKDFTSNLKCS